MKRKRQPLIALAPGLRGIRDDLDVLSLRLLDFGKGDEDDERRQRRLDAQKVLDEGFERIVGSSEHAPTAGDVRALLASLANIIDILRVLKVR